MNPNRVQVAAVQINGRRNITANLNKIQEAIAIAAGNGAQVVLFPECAVTGYRRDFDDLKPEPVDEACQAVADCARHTGVAVLLGSPVFRRGRWYNALLVFDRRGRRIHEYAKIHLTRWDTAFFARGNAPALFRIPGGLATAIICHERRYPELVRLPAMLGARILFHPNAGLDKLTVSRTKQGGRDGIAVRAFENQIYYVFANSVGRQDGGLWSAGDSKIVAPDGQTLALANNRNETIIQAEIDLKLAGRQYARDALRYPTFLRPLWQQALKLLRDQLKSREGSL